MNALTEIANRVRTDKGTTMAPAHGYTLLYDQLWKSRRGEALALLEVGLCIGGPEVEGGFTDRDVVDAPSVKMWREYFPGARIYGVDISDFSRFENDWFRFVQADCGDPAQLARVAELGVAFDIIIDDGSHAAFHQQQTMLSLMPLLKDGGCYLIEDLHWQPTDYTATLPAVPDTHTLLRHWAATGQVLGSPSFPAARWQALFADVESVMMFDTHWLSEARDQFNRQNGLTGAGLGPAKPSTRGAFKTLARLVAARYAKSPWVNGDDDVKLALIQKKPVRTADA